MRMQSSYPARGWPPTEYTEPIGISVSISIGNRIKRMTHHLYVPTDQRHEENDKNIITVYTFHSHPHTPTEIDLHELLHAIKLGLRTHVRSS
ncbi:unnamed protein product [Periconia digitata]|uniref:Uncharacterized protein n=1 Tax=Periconia digitata TaxID=1303443 RepID=A0A9W4XJL2_9PLEO|nr:unnamed protein product [Periconia digitata]